MKQILLKTILLLCLAVVGGNAWADEYSYTFQAKQFSSNGAKTLNDVSWTLSGNGNYWGYDGTKGQQFGSGSSPYKTLSLKTSDISGTITEIVVNASTASSAIATISCTVGDSDFGTQAQSLSTSATNYTFSGSASGEIVISMSQTTSKALYIKSITIIYTPGGGGDTRIATTVTIDDSGITNTNMFESTAAGSLSATVMAGDASVSGASVTWTSEHEDVAKIDNNGTVTLVGAGSTTITASFAGNDGYKPSSATYTLTVTYADPNAPGTENNPYTVAQAIDATPASGTSANVYIHGFVSAFYGDDIMSDGNNYRYYISDDGTTDNQLLVYRGKGLNNETFSSASDLQIGDEVIILGGLTLYKSTPEVASGNYLVSWQREEKPAMPTFSPEAGTYTAVQSVTLSTTTDGATIYYTIDGTEPTTESTQYTEPIEVNTTTTIKAIAVKDNVSSLVAEATFTIDLTPSIVFDGIENPLNVSYIADDTNIHYVASNTTGTITLVVCDAQGNPTTYDWFSAEITSNVYVHVELQANDDTENTRTAYFKLVADNVESDIFAITQAKYVADYAELPFSFDGGRADIANTSGLTQNDLDSDYSSSPKLKFNGTGDYVILKINERPGTLTFDIKGNSFSGSTFTVQTSEDGVTYTDLQTYTDLGSTQSEEFDNLGENVRYIKWIYTEKVSGNVALGNIELAAYAEPVLVASITVDPATVEVSAAETYGALELTYEDFTVSGADIFDVQFYDGEGNELQDAPDWIDAEVEVNGEGYAVSYILVDNDGEARTAYFKVYAMDDETNLVYSNLVTVNQAAYVAPATGDQYALFTGELVEGDYIISYNGYAMNTEVENGRLMYAEVTPENDVITTNNAAIVWHIAPCGNYWTIYNAEAKAYAAGTGAKNKAQMLASGADDMSMWTLSDSYEFVNKANAAANVNAYLRKNGTYGFACYATTTGGALSLYKKVGGEPTLATITLS